MTLRRAAIVCAGLFLVAFVGMSAAVAAPRGAKSSAESLAEEQAMMVAECKATAQQQETLKEKFKAKLTALETWDKANGAKLEAAEEAAKTARQGADDAAKKKAAGDLKTLKDERQQSVAEAEKAILAVLSDEQKIAWEGVKLAQAALPRYRKASLTDDQVAKLKAACAIAAKDIAAFPGDDKKDKQGRTTVQKSLKWAIDNVILTADQRATLPQPKK